MFERFSDRARRTVVLAQQEARLLNHNWIGTEHLLLGILAEGKGPACEAMEVLGVTLEPARAAITAVVPRGTEVPAGHIPFTPRAKTVLELSLREAFDLRRNTIQPEHILLGLFREGRGVPVQVLAADGVTEVDVRREVLELVPVERPARPDRPAPTAEARAVPVPALGGQFGGRRCSFCLRSEDYVERLVRGRTAWICDECLARAAELVADAGEGGTRQLRLPPPEVARVQADEREAAVGRAFETVFGSEASVDERLALIEDAGDLRHTVNRLVAMSRVSGDPDVWVDHVRFISADEAEVHWSPLLPGGGRMSMHGFAVLDGGVWKVSRASYHQIASLAGVPFPTGEGPAA